MLKASRRRRNDDDDYPYYEDTVTESDWHRIAIRYLELSLQRHFEGVPDVYVSSNMFVYYEKGKRDKKVSPDVFICFGVTTQQRKSYKVWENNGVAPFAAFEVTSESSRVSDQGSKRARYAQMGVQEYYLFDPLGEYLAGKFRAYRREGDELLPVVSGPRFTSPGLGMAFEVEDKLLRAYDGRTGQPYATTWEIEQARHDAEQARHDAEQARHDAEQRLNEERRRVAELEEELRRLRGG